MNSSEQLRISAKSVRDAITTKKSLAEAMRQKIESLKKEQAEIENLFRQALKEIEGLDIQAKQLDIEAINAQNQEKLL